jgi:hypothetical protein
MTAITRRRFEETLPFSLMLSTLIVFIFGFFDYLPIGFYLCLLFALAFPIIVGIFLLKYKTISDLRKNFLTPGFCIFVFIYIFVYILNFNRGFMLWDEMSHWGPMVKETLRLDKFYSVPESTAYIHKDYPPIICLFETIWCKLSNEYKEAYLYRALQTLSFSLFMPALVGFTWKKNLVFYIKLLLIFASILSTVIVVTVGEVGEAAFYQSIYIDCILGLMLAYSIFLILYEKKLTRFSIFRLSVTLSFLLLAKQIAIVFFLLILGIFALNYLIVNKNDFSYVSNARLTKKHLANVSFVAIALIVIPYSLIALWDNYVQINNIPRQFNVSSIRISDLIGIATGTDGEAFQHTILVNFLKAIFTKELIARPISLAYWQIMFLTVVIFGLISKYGNKYFEKFQINGVNTCLFLGAIGYAVVLLLLYVFNFSPSEGLRLASFDRYSGTYFFAISTLAMMLYLFIEGKKEESSKKSSFVVTAAILAFIWVVVLAPSTIAYFEPAIHYNSRTVSLYSDVETIKRKTTTSDDVYIISQKNTGFIPYTFHYLIMPQKCNLNEYSLGEPYNKDDIFTNNLIPEEWRTRLIEYDYLYLHNIDEQFISQYSVLFQPQSEIKSKQLYKIIKSNNNNIILELVE